MSRIKTGAAPKSVVSGTDTGLKIGSGGISKIDDLSDVEIGTDPVKDNSLLKWDATNSLWKPDTTFYASKAFVDSQIDALTTGLSHGVSVLSIKNDPPATAQAGNYFIVGTAPTGAWTGHANSVAHWTVHLVPGEADAFRWQFEVPRQGETHLVEDQKANYSWNNTSWVKVAAAAAAQTSNSVAHQEPIGSAGSSFTINMGSDNWTRAEIRGALRCARAATHVTFLPKTALGNESVVAADLIDFYTAIRYTNTFSAISSGANQVLSGNALSVTWLAATNVAANQLSSTVMTLNDLKITIQKTEDKHMLITINIIYWAYSGQHYEVMTQYKIRPIADNKAIQLVTFYPLNNAASISFNGVSTTY